MSRSKNGRAAETGATTTTNVNPATRRAWRTVTRNGTTYLKDPDGTRYFGTAAEIRAARLYPWRRRNLAERMSISHWLFADGTYSREELAAACAECRMEALQFNAFDRSPSSRQTEISEDMRVDMEAAARAAGVSETEFERRAIEEAVARVRRGCGGELPYTRHELAALARCQG